MVTTTEERAFKLALLIQRLEKETKNHQRIRSLHKSNIDIVKDMKALGTRLWGVTFTNILDEMED